MLRTAFALAVLIAWPSFAAADDITLIVSTDDLRIIGVALQKQPYEVVAPLIDKLNQQIATQQKKPKDGKPK